MQRISYSRIEMLSRCGEQARRRYVQGEIIPPGIALVAGGATHRAIAANLQHKLETGRLLGTNNAVDIARDAVNAQWQEGVWLNPDERSESDKSVRGHTIDKARRLTALHSNQVAPTLAVTHVERRWTIDIPDYDATLEGVIDHQEGSEAIHDVKTAKKKPADDEADNSEQLSTYAVAVQVLDGALPQHLWLDHLVDATKTRLPTVYRQHTIRTKQSVRATLARIEAALNAFKTGVFVPARRSDWWCSPKFCGYWDTCPYAHGHVSAGVP